jgi:hypothetical protein
MRALTITAVLAATSLAHGCSLSVYSGQSYAGSENTYTSGTHTLSFKAASYHFSRSASEKCCATFCDGLTLTGYRCSSDSDADVASQYRFNKVIVKSTTGVCG